MSVRLGPISLVFEGSHSVRELVEAELGRPDPQAGQSLTISVETDPPVTTGARIDGSRLMLRHSVAERDGGLRFTMGLKHASTLYTVDVGVDLQHEDSAPHRLSTSPRHLDGWSHLSSPFARMLSRDTSSLLEIAAKTGSYEIIDGIAEYRLLRRG